MIVSRRICRFVGLLLIPLFPTTLRAENWPGWRGPDRNAVINDGNYPLHWSADKNVRWKKDLPGSGIGSPIVWNDRVYLTDADGYRQSDLHIICLSLHDGREQWHVRLWGTAPTLYLAGKSSMATPTPVTDGKFVYAFFGTGDVFCIDAGGGLVWHRSLASEYGEFENRFAASSSPLLLGDLLILQCDHYGKSYAIALDTKTGVNRWLAPRHDCWLSWSSPQLLTNGTGKPELVLCGSERIDGYNPLTGDKLWTVRGMERECIPTPLTADGTLFAVSGPKGRTYAIKSGGRGDVTNSHVVWSEPRGAPFVPSAIVVAGRYYLVDDGGIASCLRARDGKLLWRSRLPGRYSASPVAADGKIYFSNEEGETTVLRSGVDRFEQLARNPLGQPVHASPALSQGKLLIRTARQLMCVE